jgi:hypothetical protein
MMTIPAAQTLKEGIQGVYSGSLANNVAVFFPIYLILSVLGTLILYRVVENPFLMLRDAKF